MYRRPANFVAQKQITTSLPCYSTVVNHIVHVYKAHCTYPHFCTPPQAHTHYTWVTQTAYVAFQELGSHWLSCIWCGLRIPPLLYPSTSTHTHHTWVTLTAYVAFRELGSHWLSCIWCGHSQELSAKVHGQLL